MAEWLLTECTDLVFFLSLSLKLEVISWVKTQTAVLQDSSIDVSKVGLQFLLSSHTHRNKSPIPSILSGFRDFSTGGPGCSRGFGAGHVGDLPGSREKAHDFFPGLQIILTCNIRSFVKVCLVSRVT